MSAASWASIAARRRGHRRIDPRPSRLGCGSGAFLDAGLGLSSISPWADSGVSAATFKTATGIYLVLVLPSKADNSATEPGPTAASSRAPGVDPTIRGERTCPFLWLLGIPIPIIILLVLLAR